MKLVDDFRILDEARKLLAGSQPGLSQTTVELTEQAVYINGVFYGLLKKASGAGKDAEFEFE